jgi:DNA (cytosine-5)-methyltransferase 1
MSKLKVLELFSGIGSQTQALKNIGIEHTSTQCDIDKYAVNVYNQLHGETKNLGDISQISEDDLYEGQWDLITYSFPCQDISLSGHQKGLEKNSGSRSSLLWECEKIFRKVKPKYLLMENVKNLVGKKFLPYFNEWLKVLEELGYTNYWKVLNSKDFGIPQNRERVFCVSILGEHKPYEFPEPQELTLRLKDILEESVDERYYLNDEKMKPIMKDVENNIKEKILEPRIKVLGNYKPSGHECGRVMDINGIAPTIKENHGAICAIAEIQTNKILEVSSNAKHQQDLIQHQDGICRTIAAGTHASTPHLLKTVVSNNPLRIRKLTPKECWRLMGWKDEDIDRVQNISNCQLYKQAGNSIVVNVLEAIFKKMFK